MSLLRCRALLSRSPPPSPPFRSSVYPLTPNRGDSPFPLPPLAQHCPFADLIRRSYIYCIEETRAAAFHAHAPPVMSGLQSCLSFRPSIQRTGRPVALHAPYLVPSPVRSLPSHPSRIHLSSPLRPAILRSLGSLAIWSRHCRPGRSFLHPDTRASNCTFLARFIWHWHEIDFFLSFFNPLDRGSVNGNVAIAYFGESAHSLFSYYSIVSNRIKLPDIYKRRDTCTYLESCNSGALLNQSVQKVKVFCITLTSNLTSYKTSPSLVSLATLDTVNLRKNLFLIKSTWDFLSLERY